MRSITDWGMKRLPRFYSEACSCVGASLLDFLRCIDIWLTIFNELFPQEEVILWKYCSVWYTGFQVYITRKCILSSEKDEWASPNFKKLCIWIENVLAVLGNRLSWQTTSLLNVLCNNSFLCRLILQFTSLIAPLMKTSSHSSKTYALTSRQ